MSPGRAGLMARSEKVSWPCLRPECPRQGRSGTAYRAYALARGMPDPVHPPRAVPPDRKHDVIVSLLIGESESSGRDQGAISARSALDMGLSAWPLMNAPAPAVVWFFSQPPGRRSRRQRGARPFLVRWKRSLMGGSERDPTDEERNENADARSLLPGS